MAERDEHEASLTPIGALIQEVRDSTGMSLTEISRRSGTRSDGRAVVIKESVSVYAKDPIMRSPEPQSVAGLARGLGVSPEIVLTRFLQSVEAHIRSELGMHPRRPEGSTPQTLAQEAARQIDDLPPKARSQIIAALNLMISGASLAPQGPARPDSTSEPVSVVAGRTAAAIYDHIGTGDVKDIEEAERILGGRRSQDPRSS